MGMDEKPVSMNRELMKNKRSILRIKLGKVDQCSGSVDDPMTEDCYHKPSKKLFSSENDLLDHKPIGELCLSHYREKNVSLNPEIDHQLKSNNAGFTVSAIGKEDNSNDVTNEILKQDLAPQMTTSEHICSVCGRSFKSMKSLSGHMRCHPDRNWRGIQPPSTVKNSSSSTTSMPADQTMGDRNDSATTTGSLGFDRLSPLSNWPVRAKRGRSISLRALKVPDYEGEFGVTEIEAIYNLLSLAHADPMETEQAEKIDKESEVESRNFTSKKLRTHKLDYFYDNGIRSGHVKIDSRPVNVHRFGYKSEKKFSYRAKFRKMSKKRHLKAVHKKRKFAASARYICLTCNKCFPSYQALGGHKASHKKMKKGLLTEGKIDGFAVNVEDDQEAAVDPAQSNPSSKSNDNTWLKATTAHQYTICNTTFPSGQALGRH